MHSWIRPPLLAGIRVHFGCLGYLKRVYHVSVLGKHEGSWLYSYFKDIKELLPLEGFLVALWWLRSSAEPLSEICG